MKELIKKINHYTIDSALKLEESDPQYKSLKSLYFNIKNKDFFLVLVLVNALICYQLSSKGEDYWEEFSSYFGDKEISDIIIEMKIFIKNSKGNKRLLNVKEKRLDKISIFIETLSKHKLEYYYNNQHELLNDLANTMNQRKDAKTITFTIKMFNYAGRIFFNKVSLGPSEIKIPIDSRLTKIYDIYNTDSTLKINDFYSEISKKLQIPELHLDAIIWVNFNSLIK